MFNKTLPAQHLILFIVFCLFSVSCSQNTPKKHILVIQSYEASFPAYKEIKQTLAQQLEKRKIQAEVYSIYLNSGQTSEKKARLELFRKMTELSDWEPDVILVNNDQALNIFLTCKHTWIKTIPTVFMGVNYPNLSFIRNYPNLTGFYDKPDYKTNIKLIEQLLGKCIVIRVSDDTFEDKEILADMDEQIKNICKINDISSLDGIRISGKRALSLSKDKKIKPDDMYISTLNGKLTRSLMRGFVENYYNKAYLATKRNYLSISLGHFGSFPGFSVINEMIGYNNGIVGGYVSLIQEETTRAANRVADILNGIPVSNFPQVMETDKRYIFDYKALEQWNINTSLLPAGSLFVNMPFYVRYQTLLLFTGLLFIISISIILFYQRMQYKRETARKKEAQETLKREKEFLSFALESGNIFTFRYKNGIFEFDKEFYHYLDMPEKPISAAHFQNAIHPDEQENFILNKYKLDHGFSSRQITTRRYDFNGKGYQWWEFRYAQNTHKQASTKNMESVEVNGLCLNIQQIKETEIKLMEARKKAEESDKMKSVFLANMSHEIRTPLNAIVGFSQLLGSNTDLENEEKTEFSELINKNSVLLLKLINDILDLSRIESGRISFTYEDCNLNQLINDIFNTHKVLMPQNVELRKQVPDNPAIIHTDRLRLTQVITNFINNATKFTSEGYIELKYQYSDDNRSIHISVTDTGKGIPADKIQQVFERFQKLDEFAQGTGLGLAISQSIVKTFKGSIHLESEVGKGSKFTIVLPYDANLVQICSN